MRRLIHFRSLSENPSSNRQRRGSIVVLAAAALVVIFAFTSFTIDLGFIALTKAELQNAADSAALGGAQELHNGVGLGPLSSPEDTATAARHVADALAALNPAGELDSVYIDELNDVRFGQLQWDDAAGKWETNWGVTPYTMIEVVTHRDRGEAKDVNGVSLDGPLPLFFGPVIGQTEASLSTRQSQRSFLAAGFASKKTATRCRTFCRSLSTSRPGTTCSQASARTTTATTQSTTRLRITAMGFSKPICTRQAAQNYRRAIAARLTSAVPTTARRI